MRILICTLCLFVFINSCKKDVSNSPDLTGRWNWTVQYNGAPANTQTPQTTGINEVLIFNTDKTWLKTQNGITIGSGTFKQTSQEKRYSYLDTSYKYSVNTLHFYKAGSQTDSTADYQITDSTLNFGNFDPGIVGAGLRVYSKQ